MQLPRKPPADPNESPAEKLLQWVRSRPAMAALLLVGVAAGFVLLIALIWKLDRGRDSGPHKKPGNPFEERQQLVGPKGAMPGGPKAAQAGGK
jgi:hypothetical protein